MKKRDIVEQLYDVNSKENIFIQDVNGTVFEYIQLALIPYNDQDYAVLQIAKPVGGLKLGTRHVFLIDQEARQLHMQDNKKIVTDVLEELEKLYRKERRKKHEQSLVFTSVKDPKEKTVPAKRETPVPVEAQTLPPIVEETPSTEETSVVETTPVVEKKPKRKKGGAITFAILSLLLNPLAVIFATISLVLASKPNQAARIFSRILSIIALVIFAAVIGAVVYLYFTDNLTFVVEYIIDIINHIFPGLIPV